MRMAASNRSAWKTAAQQAFGMADGTQAWDNWNHATLSTSLRTQVFDLSATA
jgi:hypothetical protein